MVNEKILIFSDSHGRSSLFEEAYVQNPNTTSVIFLGDGLRDFESFLELHPYLPHVAVAGNCDYFPLLQGETVPTERTLICSNLHIFLCHGHTCHVKYGMEEAEILSSRLQADLFFFGHTHDSVIFSYTDAQGHTCTFLNPGSLRDHSYGLLEIKNGQPFLSILSV